MFFLWFRWEQTSHSFVSVFIINTILGTLAWKFQGVPTTLRNYKRVIEVWFDDEYKEFFYTREPLARLIDHGDISEQLAMKERMKCKSFDWFMNEIAYDVFDKYPKLPPNKFWGELKNEGSKTCIDTMGRHPPSAIGVSGCHGGGGYQLMLLNTEVGVDHNIYPKLIIIIICYQGQLSNGEWCVKAESSDRIQIAWCEMGVVKGPWKYNSESDQIHHSEHNKCLTVHPDTRALTLLPCDAHNLYHKWNWQEITPHWAKKH